MGKLRNFIRRCRDILMYCRKTNYSIDAVLEKIEGDLSYNVYERDNQLQPHIGETRSE